MTQTLDTFFSIHRFPQRKETAYSNDEEETKNMIGSLHQSFINVMHPFVHCSRHFHSLFRSFSAFLFKSGTKICVECNHFDYFMF